MAEKTTRKQRKVSLNIRVDRDIRRRLKTLAARQEKPVTALVEQAIIEMLERKE